MIVKNEAPDVLQTSFLGIRLDRVECILPWLGFILILFVSFWLRSRYLWTQTLEYDEETNLMFGVLANAGHTPYAITFVGIPPLALLAVQLGVKLFGISLAIRYPMMFVSLLGVVGIFLAFQPWKSLFNLLTGLLAAVFLSFNDDYFRVSTTILTEVPAIAMAVVSLMLAQRYYSDRKTLWLFLSGLAFAFSLAFKLFVVFLPLLVVLLIVLSIGDTKGKSILIIRHLAKCGVMWLLGAALPLIVFAIIYDTQALFQQVFAFRLAMRVANLAQGMTPLENISTITQMLINDSPLLIGALLGAVLGWRYLRLETWLWFLWLILAMVLLIWHVPLRGRYSIIFLPSLAALSSIGVNSVWRLFYQYQKKRGTWISQGTVTLLLISIVVWTSIVPVKSAFLPPSHDTFSDLNLGVVQYIWENTTADDYIVTDAPRFAFAAKRLVPPPLSETSRARMMTGSVTVDNVINEIKIYDCPIVIYAGQVFALHLPQLQADLRELYFLEMKVAEHLSIYTGKKQTHRHPTIPLGVQLGESIVLEGIDLTSSPWRPAQEVRLATYWTATRPPPQAYKIFLQLRSKQNEIVISADHFPFPVPNENYQLIPNIDSLQNYSPQDLAIYPAKGMWPTNAWPIAQTIREVTPLTIPPNLPAGSYDLYIGMYDPDTQIRLTVQDQAGESDSVLLASIEILH